MAGSAFPGFVEIFERSSQTTGGEFDKSSGVEISGFFWMKESAAAGNVSRVYTLLLLRTLLPRTLLLQSEARAVSAMAVRLTKWIAGTAISHEFRGVFIPVFLATLHVTYRY